MKQNDIPDINRALNSSSFENIFNVYTTDDDYYFYNLSKTVNFPTNMDKSFYQNYTIELNDTWAFIAWKFYNNVKLWWVICCANQIINPTENPKVGNTLKIINSITVRNLLNNIKIDDA